MATFTSKFNLNDTVYYIDEPNLLLITGTVSTILVRHDLSRGAVSAPKIQYLLREKPVPINESVLLSSVEAKDQMSILLVKKQAETNSL